MSLFNWSTPERRKVDQVLPIIPNELYICIFEHITPPTGRLTPEELGIFARLSRVCRFFADVCLPRIFEFVEFSGSIFHDRTPTGLRNDAIYKASREATFCTQIAAKQPLALSLAKRVRSCHFTNWRLNATGSWAVRLFAKKYLDGVLHMKNIRELKFSDSFVDAEHWRVIATLESLEDLSFDSCKFLQAPADVEPEEWVKVKVSRLQVTDCTGHRQPVAAIHPQHLRTLVVDSSFDQVDWLPQSSLIELHLHLRCSVYLSQHLLPEKVHTLLAQLPQSLATLWLSADLRTAAARDMVRGMFTDLAWKNLSLLRSLTLHVHCNPHRPENDLSFVLDCISLLTGLQSFTLDTYLLVVVIPPTEVRQILHDKLGPSSSLTYADIYGKVFRLVDGEWSHTSCGTA